MRKVQEHTAEISSLEIDILHAETRCRDALRLAESLRLSREGVAQAVGMAIRRRCGGMLAAATGRGGESALRWCFWGWARVARGGDAATTTRARRLAGEEELRRVTEQLRGTVEQSTNAESERDEHR